MVETLVENHSFDEKSPLVDNGVVGNTIQEDDEGEEGEPGTGRKSSVRFASKQGKQNDSNL